VGCVKAVVTAFKKADGVSEATVDFAKATATVTFDPKKTNADTLTSTALKGTRYTAAKLDEKDKDKKEKDK